MNVLLVQNEKQQNDKLIKNIERSYIDSRVYQCSSFKSAIDLAMEKKIDLFLIEDNLSDGSGTNLAARLRFIDRYKTTGIVFITNDEIDIMKKIKKIHSYECLIKPYDIDSINNIIDSFMIKHNAVEEKNKYIVVNDIGGVTTKVYYEDIIFIEYRNRNCDIRTKYGQICARGYGLNKLLLQISDSDIIQCHKSFAVNKNYIEKIVKIKNKIMEIHFLSCEESIPLGYKYKNNIMNCLK